MKKCNEKPSPLGGQSEAGLNANLYSAKNKYEEIGIDINKEGDGNRVFSDFRLPSLTPRHYGLMPYEVWPSRTAYIRYMATSRPAISMRVELRREAAADPGLEYDAQHYRYRLKRSSPPHPPEPAAG